MNACGWDMGHGTFVTVVTHMRSNKEKRVAFATVVGTWDICDLQDCSSKRGERWPEEGHATAKLACAMLSIRRSKRAVKESRSETGAHEPARRSQGITPISANLGRISRVRLAPTYYTRAWQAAPWFGRGDPCGALGGGVWLKFALIGIAPTQVWLRPPIPRDAQRDGSLK